MKVSKTFSIVFLLSIVFMSCEQEKKKLVEVAEADAASIIASGHISVCHFYIKEGTTDHYAIFYLNEAGKKAKLDEIGIHRKPYAYYKVYFSDPDAFEKLLNTYQIRVHTKRYYD